ncbi:Hypothetical predicted protein, partial [Paramuricea clavata]
MNVIQCYAPTNERDEDSKDQFYSRLQTIVESCPGRDFTIMMGDFNKRSWAEVMARGHGQSRTFGTSTTTGRDLQICVHHTTWSSVEASFLISDSI